MEKIITAEIIDFANHLADLSTEVIKKYFRKNCGEKNKDNNSPVTLADKETEEVIRNAIRKKFPTHGIIGEEFENHDNNENYKWVIDPIDGTSSFVIGKPIFGTLIALTYKGKPLLGIINQPITGERWIGIIDKKTTLNNKIIKTRYCQNISDAILCTTSPAFFKGKNSKIFKALSSKTKYQKYDGVFYGGDCYIYGLMALGLVDIIIERGLSNYDFMALIPVIKSAGGVITDWSGKELDLKSDGAILACGNKALHRKALKIIAEAKL